MQHREERRINLLLKQATLPKIPDKPFDWRDIQLAPGITREYVLLRYFIENQENLILYGGVGTGKTFLSTLISINTIKKKGKKVKFYTASALVNALLEANDKGSLAFVKMFVQGRNLLYDNIEVNNLSDGYEVKTHTWYESEIPEAFFYFDMDAEEFANYSAKLAIKNAEKLGINLSIKKEGNIEIAYIKKLTNHSVE